MTRAFIAVPSVASLLIASVALACGGAPPMPSPGYTGTTVAEHGGTLSMFVGNPSGYQWQRVDLSTQQTTIIGQVPGHFSGSIETDSRSVRGIAGQNGKLVSFAADDVSPLSDDPAAQVDVFGAALSKDGRWNVFAYDATAKTITYFYESSLGRFDKVGTLQADCGQVLMLDVAAEDDGDLEGLCGQVAFERVNDELKLTELPVAPQSLTLGSDGKAIAFGSEAKQGGLQLMKHDSTGWTRAGTLGTEPAEIVWALDEKSVLVRHGGGFTAYTNQNGTWNASQTLDASTALTSVGGHPAKVFAGDYDLTVYATDGSENGAWTATSLGALGTPPQAGGTGKAGAGCSIVGTALPFALLGLMSMSRFRRRFAKQS